MRRDEGDCEGAVSVASRRTLTAFDEDLAAYFRAFEICQGNSSAERQISHAECGSTYEVPCELANAAGIGDDNLDPEAIERGVAGEGELDVLVPSDRVETLKDVVKYSFQIARRQLDREKAQIELGDIDDVCRPCTSAINMLSKHRNR